MIVKIIGIKSLARACTGGIRVREIVAPYVDEQDDSIK